MKDIIALLPMKAHSERIPKKNFKNFNGKPLFYWILEQLLQVERISKIVINTDAIDILSEYEIVKNESVILREREPELRGDFVSMNKVIESDVNSFGSGDYIMTHTTNPLISKRTINEAIDVYNDSIVNGHDSLFSVNKFQSRFYYNNIKPINHDPEQLLRTQDLEPIYEENSCLYLFSERSFKKSGARIGLKPNVVVTNEIESVDIDDESTWLKANLNYKLMNNEI